MALARKLKRSRRRRAIRRPKVLVVDVGGTRLKVLATGHRVPREIPSGPTTTARDMVAAVKRSARD
jgi:hypothetical protein